MSDDKKIEMFRRYKDLDRAYSPQELVHELQELVDSGAATDIMVIYIGEEGRGSRFASIKKREWLEDLGMINLMLQRTLFDLMDQF